MDTDHAYASIEILGAASVASLGRAMGEVYATYDYGQGDADSLHWLPRFTVNWSLDPKEEFNDDLSYSEPVSLSLMRDGNLVIEVVARGRPPRNEFDSWPQAESILKRWLGARRGRFVSTEVGDIGYRGYWLVRFALPFRGLTVSDIQSIGTDAIGVLDTYSEGDPTLESLIALLRSGQARALIGLTEGQLLEAKRQVNLQDMKGKLELAKDVSAIANSKTGGLIVVGLETQRRAGVDEIVRIRPFTRAGEARNIRAVIDRYIYPPIDGLEVDFAPATAKAGEAEKILTILVPPQPAELTPFLVVGAVSDGRVLGSYIGLFERRGEDTVAKSAASIHAGLSAGLALFRGLPARNEEGTGRTET